VPFKLTHHDSKYFHAQGTKGPFKIAKRGLGKGQHDKYLAMCDGGVVPQKLARGGNVQAQDQKMEEATAGFFPPTTGEKVASALLGPENPPVHGALKAFEYMTGPENPPVHYAMKALERGDPSGIMSGGVGVALAPERAAAGAAKAAAAAAPKAAARTRVGLIPWDEMKLPEAVAAARDKAHLLQLEGGHYVGAPPQVTNPAKLGSMRGKIDKAVERGAFGADWYERARGAISEISHGDPKTADRLSAMLANYSPQATPDANFGWAIQQTNRAAHEGPAASALVPPKTKVQANKGAKIAAGEPLDLGPKAGVYEQHINPNKADEAMVRGVNDLWQGRVFGYPPGKDASVGSGLAAKAGFSDAQHSFMTGENLLAAERAKAKGLLPQVETPNVGNVQAASWVGQRYNQLLAKEKAAAAKAKEAGKPFKAKTDAQLREKASQSYDTVLDKYTGNETFETAPGRNVKGNMEGYHELPFEKKVDFAGDTRWSPPGQADPFYKALDMPARPTQEGLGQFGNDMNPNFTAKPVVSYTKGNASKGGMNVPDERMMQDVNRLRTVLDAQDSGGYHALRQSGGGKNAATVRFPQPLDEAGTRNLYKQAEAAGLNLIDTGGGTFTVTGDFGGMAARDFTKRMGAMQEPLAGARATPARFLPGHEGQGLWSPQWGEEGAGAVTKDLLEGLHPNTIAKIDASPELREIIAGRAPVFEKAAQRAGIEPPRGDLQRLRQALGAEGIQALMDRVAKDGYKGLPAIVPFLLADQMGGPEKHAQGGIAGEQVQRFADGGVPAPMNFTPTPPPYTPGEMPPPTVEEQRMALGYGRPAPYMPPTTPYDSVENTGVAAAEGQTPVGLGTGWDAVKDGVKADVAQGLKGYGELADNVLPSNLGTKYLKPAGEALSAPPRGDLGDQPAADGPPYMGAGSLAYGQPQGLTRPTSAPAQDVAPAPPALPQLKPWGVGAPQAIAAGEKMAGEGLKQKAKIEQDFFNQMGELQRHAADGAASISAQSQERYRQRTAISDKMERDLLDAKVNPNQFFESKDTGQKILAGIGMLFSGIGAGLTGQPNLAMDVINRAIDRDIDSQKFNINKNQNYLSYYVKKTGDDLTAAHYMKADLLDSVAAQIKAKEFGMQASSVGPLAQIAYGQLKMQAARERQTAAFQELQGQQVQWDLRMKQYQMEMMQRMVGAGPGAGAKGDHTNFLRQGVTSGVFPMDKMAPETVREPIIGPDGRPQVGADGQVLLKPAVTTLRMYNDPERAREAGHIFNTAPTLKAAVQRIEATLRAHPTGTEWLQDPQANAALKTDLAHVYVAYETMVNGLKRQPNDTTINVIKDATSKPGSITSSILGTSMASMDTIIKQTDAMLQSYRDAAWY
jgi:hypothetical protein